MKKNRFAVWIFAALAVVIAAVAIGAVLLFREAPPMLLKTPDAASETADAFMAAVCDGKFDTAQQLLYGIPELGENMQPAQETGRLIWDAFVDSTDYALKGDCFPVESGLAQEVTFLSLDISSVTENLGTRAKVLLEQRLAQAEDTALIYGQDNNFREDLVLEILEEVTRQAIREDARYVEQTVTLKLIWQDGRWWILPEQQVLNQLFGAVQ